MLITRTAERLPQDDVSRIDLLPLRRRRACAVETVGADHFLFGTDAPPLTSLKKQGVEMIKQLGLSPEDERKVYGDNAVALLKL